MDAIKIKPRSLEALLAENRKLEEANQKNNAFTSDKLVELNAMMPIKKAAEDGITILSEVVNSLDGALRAIKNGGKPTGTLKNARQRVADLHSKLEFVLKERK
jgi:uncharacterized protein YicC (UPF0701 family)